MQYPISPIKKVTKTIHGHKITDNYRWLEDTNSIQVKNWVKAQNKLTNKFIKPELRAKLEKEIAQSFNFPSFGIPYLIGGWYFQLNRTPKEDQHILYVSKSLDGKKRVLIDPNKLSKKNNNTTSLDFWFPSSHGKYLAYGISYNGNELSILKILNIKTGKDLEIVAQNASYSSVAWLDDESGFYYTKHPDPGSVKIDDERYYEKVFFHRIGTDAKFDEEIFGKNRSKEEAFGLNLSPDNSLLFISSNQNMQHDDIILYNILNKEIKELIKGYMCHNCIYFTEDKILLLTNYKAPNYRILSTSIKNLLTDLDKWNEFIPEKNNKLEWCQITNDQLIAVYLINASYRAITYDLTGKETGKLLMSNHASILEISTNPKESEFFYEFSSFVTPEVTYRYNSKTKHMYEFNRMDSIIDDKDYIVKQEWYKSKDGTSIPMFIVHHKDVKLNSKNPTILYGYGGFEISLTPTFLAGIVPILKRGWVYALANIRGGGEFGDKWHQDGIKEKKQNSYDDFIAAAEYLINNKYTDNHHLGIMGGSNGGLLVNVVAIQRPELFKAVVSLVPLADMVRFPNFLIASRWVQEFGDPSNSKDLINLLRFSPYHNVKDGVEYPAFFFATASKDTRVDPMHAYKMTALLQSKNKKNPVLLYNDSKSGHMGSASYSHFYKEQARLLAFFIEQLD